MVHPNCGNQYHLALKDPEVRQKAYKSFCDHLAEGFSIKSWCYEDEKGNACTWQTMQTYIKDNPSEFNPVTQQVSQIKGYRFWESTVRDSATGKNKDASTASLQMIMRNKYGWDKEEKQASTAYTIKIDRDGLATGVSTEKVSASNPESAE
jgi:hypothetical protein